ncbi:hypothetical protein P692DRAFT_20878492 [Suillus brevipes Sb2]|nr:hypothetical protein P692DRAFT_20878492 [Suillus brevipes Sb2]
MPWTSFDIRLFAFPALCDTYATYATFTLITRIRDIRAPQAPKARMFPRLMQHSHATLASSAIYCHHEFASLRHLEESLSLTYRIRALPLHKRECSRASRAYVALFTRPRHVTRASLQSFPYHSGSHHHHIPELTLCLHTPESLRAFCCSTALSCPYDALRLRLSRA